MTLPEWKDRRIERENTYKVLNNKDGTVTLIPVTGEIYESGTPLNALNLNKINAHLEHNVNQLGNKIDEVASKGTTTEVLERVTKEEIDRQIKDGTIANLTIENHSITSTKIKKHSINITNLDASLLDENNEYDKIFYKDDIIINKYYEFDGTLTDGVDVATSDFIMADVGDSIYISNCYKAHAWDSEKNFVSLLCSHINSSFSTKINDDRIKYITFDFPYTTLNTVTYKNNSMKPLKLKQDLIDVPLESITLDKLSKDFKLPGYMYRDWETRRSIVAGKLS